MRGYGDICAPVPLNYADAEKLNVNGCLLTDPPNMYITPMTGSRLSRALTLASLCIVRLIMLDKIQCVILRNKIDTAYSIFVGHTIYLVCNLHKFRPESGGYELGA